MRPILAVLVSLQLKANLAELGAHESELQKCLLPNVEFQETLLSDFGLRRLQDGTGSALASRGSIASVLQH